jgi:Fe-S-cluster containining protein
VKHPLVTDLGEIRRRAEANEEVDRAFRRLLKDCAMEEADIDAAVHRIYAGVAAQVDCRACANCCRALVPALDRRDIKRLSAAVGMTPGQFRREYLTGTDEPGRLVLKQRPCAFLDGNLCRHYAQRPEACREFPHLHKPDFTGRSMLIILNLPYCPIIFNTIEQLKVELGPLLFRR